jgi:hypothetical protein
MVLYFRHISFQVLIFIFVLYFSSFPLSLRTTILPRDIPEALLMLKSGALDSLEWNMLETYYVQPIEVPLGELGYLNDLLDNRLQDLPVSPDKLAGYEPWAAADIARFFSDYPQLKKYEPILSFSRAGARRFSNAGLAVSSDENWKTTALSRFSLQPRRWISIRGSAGLSDTALLWKRRAVSATFPGLVSFEAGNFQQIKDGGLFYGYFPDDNQNVTTLSNWRYGMSNTWNGISLKSDCWKHAQISAFFHDRTTERAYGFFCDAEPNEILSIKAGVSSLETSAQDSSGHARDYFLHCGVSAHKNGFGISVNTGLEKSRPMALPFSAEFTKKADGAELKVFAARIPASLQLSRSRIAFDCRDELDAKDSTGPDISLVDCTTGFRVSDALFTTMGLSSVLQGGTAALCATAGASGTVYFDYRVLYTYRMSTAASQETHAVFVSIDRAFSPRVKTGLSVRSYFASTGYQSVFSRILAEFCLLPGLQVGPYVTLFGGTGGEWTGSLGFKQALHLFEKTWCEWDIAASADNKNEQKWNLNARAYYCF